MNFPNNDPRAPQSRTLDGWYADKFGNVVPFRNHDLALSTQERVTELRLELAIIRERIAQHEKDIAALERLKVAKADSLEIYMRALAREVRRG